MIWRRIQKTNFALINTNKLSGKVVNLKCTSYSEGLIRLEGFSKEDYLNFEKEIKPLRQNSKALFTNNFNRLKLTMLSRHKLRRRKSGLFLLQTTTDDKIW